MERIKELVYSRELRWNEVLSIGMTLFHTNFKTILWGLAMICLPISLLEAVIQMRLLNISDIVLQAGDMLSIEQAQNYLTQMGINNILIMLINVLLMPIFMIGVAKAAKWRLEGRQFEPGNAFSQAMLCESTVVKVGIVYMVLVVLGSFLLFIPGIYLSVVWCLYLYCIGLGHRRGLDALGHSRLLVRERWWRTFGFLILLNFVMVGWSSFVGVLFLPLPDNIYMNIVMNCIIHLGDAYVVCQMTVVFLNRESGLYGMASLQEEPEETPKEEIHSITSQAGNLEHTEEALSEQKAEAEPQKETQENKEHTEV